MAAKMGFLFLTNLYKSYNFATYVGLIKIRAFKCISTLNPLKIAAHYHANEMTLDLETFPKNV